jgi:uridine kinase
VLLAGPSGSGKTHLAEQSGLPLLDLDDFYKDGDDPTLPRQQTLGIVDWDDPASWDAAAALVAIEAVCRDGYAEVPVYDIAHDGRVGSRDFSVGSHLAFVATGIFAAELVGALRQRGLLADAVVVRRARWKNLLRRLRRDLAEHRKPPLTLVRRGLALARAEPAVVARQLALGCRPCDRAGTLDALRRADAASGG